MAQVTDLADARQLSARERIIDAAERLFAERGYHAVSLRTIMGAAGVNVSAAHYYFGSKEGLLRCVFERRVNKINANREQRLRQCIEEYGDAVPVEKVLEAYIGPAIEVASDPSGRLFVRVAALATVDPNPEVRDIINSVYDATGKLFVQILRKACPHLTDTDLFWRLHCVHGSMMYIRANNGRIARLLDRNPVEFDSLAVHEALRNVIPCLAAAFAVPSQQSFSGLTGLPQSG